MDIRSMCEMVYQNAVDHGWYDKKRETADVIVMIHCEVSEAVEEFRNGHPNLWVEDGKPEGICVEFADVIIRCFDYLGSRLGDERTAKEIELYQKAFDEAKEQPLKVYTKSVGEIACEIHKAITFSYANAGKYGMMEHNLLHAAWLAYEWIAQTGIEPDALIMQKHMYNVQRPYRHGGKVI